MNLLMKMKQLAVNLQCKVNNVYRGICARSVRLKMAAGSPPFSPSISIVIHFRRRCYDSGQHGMLSRAILTGSSTVSELGPWQFYTRSEIWIEICLCNVFPFFFCLLLNVFRITNLKFIIVRYIPTLSIITFKFQLIIIINKCSNNA